MFHKREKEYQEGLPPSKKLKANIGDLYLSNQISAQRAQEIFQDIKDAGAGSADMKQLSKGLNSELAKKLGRNPNAARDLGRRLLKRCPWPEVYWCQIPVMDVKLQQETTCLLPMLLPHELIHTMLKHADKKDLLHRGGLSPVSLAHLLKLEEVFDTRGSLAVGLWLDGTPYSFDRLLSLESVVINFPGLAGANKGLRLPITVIPKHFCIKEKTFDAILHVYAWSMQHAAAGFMPTCRHDSSAWQPTDKARAKISGSPLGVSAYLVEIRGDWAMRKDVFGFPGWRENSGICHVCHCTNENMDQFDSQAEWKLQGRLEHWQLMTRMLLKGKHVSSIFSCPGLTASQFLFDFLHNFDQGITADFLGNLFFYIVSSNHAYLPGGSRQQRIRDLFLKIRNYYAAAPANEIASQLGNLTEGMIRKSPSSSPKLRAKAAEARSLVNFAAQLCHEAFPPETATGQEACMRQAALRLQRCYACLQDDRYDQDQLLDACSQFCSLVKALQDKEACLWIIKPKHHGAMEVCLQEGSPSLTWTYRDEDMGGYLASLAKLKGGSHNPRSVAHSVLQRWRAKGLPHLKPS